MKNLWFITGTDTNIGKTLSSVILLKLATIKGYHTAGYKPIASGCKSNIKKFNCDAMLLKSNSSIKLTYKEVNPFLFFEPVCPYFINNNTQFSICTDTLSSGLLNLKKKSNWIVIEGIGGWYTPISKHIILSDWVKKENLKTILVIGIKTGCINHAILTQEAIMRSSVKFSGWIANYILPKNKYDLEHIKVLKKYLISEYLGYIPYYSNIKKLYEIPNSIRLPSV